MNAQRVGRPVVIDVNNDLDFSACYKILEGKLAFNGALVTQFKRQVLCVSCTIFFQTFSYAIQGLADYKRTA